MAARTWERRIYWIAKACGIGTATAFAASALVTTLGTQLAYGAPSPAPETVAMQLAAESPKDKPVAMLSSAAAAKARTSAGILSRNVFCPTCVATNDADADEDAEVVDLTPPQPLALELVATMVSTDPTRSLATLRDPASGASGVFAAGDALLPGAMVVAVRDGVVTIDVRGAMQSLYLGKQPPVASTVRPTTRPASAKPAVARAGTVGRTASSVPGASEAIACSSADRCSLERGFVNALMSNPASLASQATVRLTKSGFAFARVRPGTIPALLGLETGDVLTAVNGQSLSSLDDVFAQLTKLRHASYLEVTLSRKGKSVTKSFDIS